MGVQEERKRLFGLRRLKRPKPGEKPIPERCLTCAHYKPWVVNWWRDKGEAEVHAEGKKITGSCTLLGGAVHEWMVCNKYRSV